MRAPAKYSSEGLPNRYRGHPFIEALPPILSPQEAARLLLAQPDMNIEELLQLPPHLRAHELDALDRLYIPRREIVKLESDIAILMRSGYLKRDPRLVKYTEHLDSTRSRMRNQRGDTSPQATCMVVQAASGAGKTRGIQAVLSMTPQTIIHSEYAGTSLREVQIAWISVQCPINGSVAALEMRIFAAIDAALGQTGAAHSYFQHFSNTRMSIDQRLEHLAQLAATYHLGLLHIDDLQRLTEVREQQSTMLFNLIIQLSNVVKVPLVFSGTEQMARAVASSFEAARRSTVGGIVNLELPESVEDPHFRAMVGAFFRYQLVRQPLELTEDIFQKIFEMTLGIPAAFIAMFKHAQRLALDQGGATMTAKHLDESFAVACEWIAPALEALRSGSLNRYRLYEDLLSARMQMAKQIKNRGGEHDGSF